MTVIKRGWGLQESNGRLRKFRSTDSTGFMKGQVAIWPTKRDAQDMSIVGEYPVKVRVMYIVDSKEMQTNA